MLRTPEGDVETVPVTAMVSAGEILVCTVCDIVTPDKKNLGGTGAEEKKEKEGGGGGGKRKLETSNSILRELL